MLCVVIFGIWQLIHILRAGIFPGRRGAPDIHRKDSPGQFWAAIAIYCFILLVMIHFTILFLQNTL
ncbi:hypothetical protein Lepto7376_1326 [[Leptolyngbya] sp. PCC 7376]|nr:hypothetical protein Lepto7376_1326 [[Leptolyngbya] sp. PCC 7376]